MKKHIITIIIAIAIIGLTGCNSDKTEIQALKSENNSLKSNMEKLTKENDSLKSQIDELNNGAEKRINEIKDAFSKKSYDKVIELSKKLSELHPGSKESIECEKLVSQVNAIKDEEKKKADIEAEKIKKEAEKSAQEKARGIIRIKSAYPSKPNSASGVDLHIIWQNKSDKVIKYAAFEVNAYNAVNDIVGCDIKGNTSFRGKLTGPVNPGEWWGEDKLWECAWYNNTIKSVQIIQVDIDYMDGTSVSLSPGDISYVTY